MKVIHSIEEAIALLNDFEEKKEEILLEGVQSIKVLKFINYMREEEITLLNELSDYLESPKGADDIIIQCDLIDKTKDFLNEYSQTINKLYDDLFRDEQYYDGEEH